ncbi:MAG: heme biosynthesis protein HemY [Maricaulaceae bacterium]
MLKYIIGIVMFMVLIVAMLLYIDQGAVLSIISTSKRDVLSFNVELSLQSAIVIGLLGLIGIIVLWSFLNWLFQLPGRLKSGMGLRKRNQALDAMEEALLSGAAGDVEKTRKISARARNLIGSAALGQIVSAQAAEACGDNEEAISHYRAMLEDEKTHATGRRGLAQHLLAAGDFSGAIELADAAYDGDKSARWAFDTLFTAQVSDHRWVDAAATLDRAERRKHLDKDIIRRRRAVLLTAQADHLTDAGETPDVALDLAMRAAQDVPDFAPGVALAARLLLRDDNKKKAISVIEKAWSKRPHPALAIAFTDMLNSKDRAKRIAGLVKQNPDHTESALLLAGEALDNGNGVEALSALNNLVSVDAPSARLCQMAYRAETALGNKVDARHWLERAASAPSEADWTDLDPEGDAFDYTDQDWRRMVYSFGETGELIHPRFETGAASRSVLGCTPKGEDTEVKPEAEEALVTDDKTDVAHDTLEQQDAPAQKEAPAPGKSGEDKADADKESAGLTSKIIGAVSSSAMAAANLAAKRKDDKDDKAAHDDEDLASRFDKLLEEDKPSEETAPESDSDNE